MYATNTYCMLWKDCTGKAQVPSVYIVPVCKSANAAMRNMSWVFSRLEVIDIGASLKDSWLFCPGGLDSLVMPLHVTPFVGGPAPKMLFFQMVPKSFLSVLRHSNRCKNDSLYFFQKFCLEPARWVGQS